MNVLGLAQGWWTVIGLASDLFGFCVLAWEVLKSLRSEEINLSKQSEMDTQIMLNKRQERYHKRKPGGLEEQWEMFKRSNEFGRSRFLLENRRSNAVLGMAFVLLGFVLQIVGAWPV